jgi:hypothetical protein
MPAPLVEILIPPPAYVDGFLKKEATDDSSTTGATRGALLRVHCRGSRHASAQGSINRRANSAACLSPLIDGD